MGYLLGHSLGTFRMLQWAYYWTGYYLWVGHTHGLIDLVFLMGYLMVYCVTNSDFQKRYLSCIKTICASPKECFNGLGSYTTDQ